MTMICSKVINNDDTAKPWDDVQCSTSLEMGRRKLPSIPTQRTERSAKRLPLRSTSHQAPRLYLRLPTDNTILRILVPTHNPLLRLLMRSQIAPSTDNFCCSGDRSSVLGHPSSAKMPSPLARVLLKKELKEVLERRRESLEACEIEANQRQYIVHRMLITGLLPEYRSVDIDNIPNVIPCLLPVELISGARVVPSEIPSTTTSVTTTPVPERSSVPPSLSSAQSGAQEVGISTDDFRLEPKLKSVGVQSESSLPLQLHILPYLAQRQAEHDRYDTFTANTDVTAVLQPQFRSTETQTNGVMTYEAHSNRSSGRRHRSSASNLFSSSEPNLLESTAKYFAEYDRQLREHGRRLKNRFAFNDDDPVNRETRKQRVMDELAQRKEKISSMIDLYSPSAFPTIHPTSDYSSTVPHYGSLPGSIFLHHDHLDQIDAII
ncbi:C2 domain protein [Dirofilaria immitis]|nr:C2 domain protein [Dirofilaria immitis]